MHLFLNPALPCITFITMRHTSQEGRKEGNCELTVILLHCQLNTHPVIPKNKTYVIVRSDNCHFLHILHIFLTFSSFISHAKQTSACQMSKRMTIIFIAIDRFAIGNVMKYWSEQLDGTIDEREDRGENWWKAELTFVLGDQELHIIEASSINRLCKKRLIWEREREKWGEI